MKVGSEAAGAWWLNRTAPLDVRLAIASWLDEEDLVALSTVDKASLEFARHNVLWMALYDRR